MRLVFNEKKRVATQSLIESIFIVGGKSERFPRMSIYKVYFTNVRAISNG